MSIKTANFEKVIREYLLEEGILKEKITSKEFDFGFVFSFPPGGLRSQNMSIYKPKTSNNIFITIRYQISEERVKLLSSLKEDQKIKVFKDLRKYFLIKEVNFSIDIQKMIIEIHEQFYPQKERIISKDSFFKRIQKVFYCYIYSNLILEEYCMGKDKKTDKYDFNLFS
ncbi:MAG: DUF2299 family protein [Promethearchaeota archaeon]